MLETPSYVVARRKGNETARWWRACSMERRPYIEVLARTRYATLTLDMVTAERDLTESERLAIADSITMGGVAVTIGYESVTVDRLGIETAKELAQTWATLVKGAPC